MYVYEQEIVYSIIILVTVTIRYSCVINQLASVSSLL